MKSLSEQLVGSWTVVSHETVRPDGSRVPVYGVQPKGIAIFDSGGRFVITMMRADRVRFSIDHPAQGTVEENRMTSQEP